MEDYPLLELLFHNGSDSKLLVITDASLYAEPSVNPMLDIKLPGFTSYRSVPFIPSRTNTFTAMTLGIQPISAKETTDLPDGVYEVIYRSCPYETQYKKFYWLRDDSYRCQYLKIMSYWIEVGYESMPKAASDILSNAERFKEAADAAAAEGYSTKSSKFYQKALSYLEYLENHTYGLRVSK